MKKTTYSLALGLLALTAFSSKALAQQTAYGLNTGGLTFQTFNITTPNLLSAATGITGLNLGETILAIDFRPSDSLIYGYSSTNRLYTITTAGVATFYNAFGTVAATQTMGTTTGLGSDTPSNFPPNASVTIDINPNVPASPMNPVGALRIVDNAGTNLRFAFANNTLNRDDTLTYPGMGVPQVVGVAYTNSDLDPLTGTSLYYIEATTDSLYTTTAPNDGVLTLVGSLGIDVTSNVGFDIPLFASSTSPAYLSANGNFYSVNLATGAASLVGTAGSLTAIRDIAVAPEPGTNLLILGGLGAIFFAVRRSRAQRVS